MKYLIEHGADVDQENVHASTPLHTAVKSDSLEIVEYLILKGADVNYVNNISGTPLHTAAESSILKIAKYLVEHAADINCGNNDEETPLDVAAKTRSLEMVEYFFENSATVRREDDDLWNEILYLACEKSSVVESILKNKAIKDINRCFDCNWSPLRTACYHGHTAVVQALLKYNVDIRKEKKNWNAGTTKSLAFSIRS